MNKVVNEKKNCPEVLRSVLCDFVIDIFALVCVYFRGNTVHNADRKSIRRSPQMEDFC